MLVQTPRSNYLGPLFNVAFGIIFHMSTSSDNQLFQTFVYLKVSTNFLFKLLISSTHRVRLAHLILFHHIWCNFIHPPVTSYLLGPHPLLRHPLSLLFPWSERLRSAPTKTSKITSCMLLSMHFRSQTLLQKFEPDVAKSFRNIICFYLSVNKALKYFQIVTFNLYKYGLKLGCKVCVCVCIYTLCRPTDK